jgi:hypothetical protein
MYTFNAPPDTIGCVFRLSWGEKYVIVKAKTFVRAKTIIEQSLHAYLVRGKQDLLYNRFFGYIKLHPGLGFVVKILYKGDNPYQLLKHEQIFLDKSRLDPNCFNQTFDAYVPKGIQGKRKSWINRGHYLNFCLWRKKHLNVP